MAATNSAKSNARLWLLAPHAVAVLAFLAAFAVVYATQSNQTRADLTLGIIGYAATALALITTLAALWLHPWRDPRRDGRGADWLRLLLHAIGLAACLALGFAWIGAHLV